MKAVVSRGVGDIRIEDMPEPTIEQSTDAIARLASSTILDAGLHFVRGTAAE
jgi:threonine dehydrogenase-like Zn-dependent dehydrogenase